MKSYQFKIIFGLWVPLLFLVWGVPADKETQSNNNKNSNEDSLSDIFSEILQVPIPFASEEDEKKCQTIIGQLTEVEIEVAARTSYAYWFLEQQQQNDNRSCPSESRQNKSALREARRHLIAANGNEAKALDRLKEACQYRQEHQLDALREYHSTQQQLAVVAKDMKRQTVVMRGHDRDSRAVLIKYPRSTDGVTQEEYLTTQLYIAERANACTEFVSRGRHETLTAIFDFGASHGTSKKHNPPMSWQLSAIQTLQQLYPERLHKLVILEPPFWMRGIFSAIRPFLSGTTRHKIELVSDRSKIFEDWSQDDDNASESSRRLLVEEMSKPVDVNRYIKDIPFHFPYNVEDYAPKFKIK